MELWENLVEARDALVLSLALSTLVVLPVAVGMWAWNSFAG